MDIRALSSSSILTLVQNASYITRAGAQLDRITASSTHAIARHYENGSTPFRDFFFAVKCRNIYHQNAERCPGPAATFFASGGCCREKIFPMHGSSRRGKSSTPEVETFFEIAAVDGGCRHARRRKSKRTRTNRIETPADFPIRYAIELRNESFFTPEFIALLRKHNIALAFADTVQDFGYAEDVTSDFIYIRLHGKEELYASDYADHEIDDWARKVKA